MPTYHKIPQNVISYQGRVIGKFTAKQFTFLAIGGVILFILWSTPIPRVVQIFLSIPTVIITLVFALANIGGKTTDAWILSFLSSVYAPTQRIWRKRIAPPIFMHPNYHPPHRNVEVRKKREAEVDKFIEFWQPHTKISDLTDEEKAKLTQIRQLK